jgi:hypothetical protein
VKNPEPRVLGAALRDADARAILIESLRGLPWALQERRVVPHHVEDKLRTLDRKWGLRALTG